MKEKIKKFIAENWFKGLIILLVISGFYWFGLREEIIKKNCNVFAMERVHNRTFNLNYGNSLYTFWFRECINGRIFH